ncbi:hypothetical protein VTN77DRAFT_8099 [Rasamsonia byssochlamydoides]|uniref:uncharacterized protein n=1 Tax=Rasamsonia byssochlamydoides TaxID=89139 RepID=UPI00374394D4
MHTTLVNVPIRTAVLGTRFSCVGLAPFAYVGSASTPFNQQQQTMATKVFQKRSASSFATKGQNHVVSCSSCTRLSCQRPTLLLRSSPRSAQAPTLVAAVQKGVSGIRANSTTSAASTSRNANTASDEVPLDWNTFFKLRTSRRRYSLVSSIITSIASTAVGIQILSTQDLESLGAQVMGLDPFVVLGLATAACGAVGWLAGPFLGNAIWGLVYRRFRSAVVKKDKEFYDRIKRFRVDPSSNSIANPVPDYYGEKIGSVQGYRQWLKDQRAYNRKKQRFIL